MTWPLDLLTPSFFSHCLLWFRVFTVQCVSECLVIRRTWMMEDVTAA